MGVGVVVGEGWGLWSEQKKKKQMHHSRLPFSSGVICGAFSSIFFCHFLFKLLVARGTEGAASPPLV